MLKIYGRSNSINVDKTLWCASELGLAFERVDVGGAFGGNHEPWYLALNPNGLVPTIDDDGFVLWESNTIVRYLAAKHATGTLWPSGLLTRALAERWMDWEATTLARDMSTLFVGLVRTKPENRDVAALEKARATLAEVWARLDAHLADNRYVAGDDFTMGDIPAGALAYRWFSLSIHRPLLPNLEAWYLKLRERPAYREHVVRPLS